MQKYEAVRNIFTQLLHHNYEPVEIDLLDGWRLKADVSAPKVDSEKPYLGLVPIALEFYQGSEWKKNYLLSMRFVQTTLYPSLEDMEGGYALFIRSSKSELLFRAMQAAKYDIINDQMTVHITTDLNSKRGITNFRENIVKCIEQYRDVFEQWGGKRPESNQFTYATYEYPNDTFTQNKQNILQMSLLLAVFKAVLKGELEVPLSALIATQPTPLEPRIWKIAPGSKAMYWDNAVEDGNIFIGWPELGDLKQYDTYEQLKKAYVAAYNPQQEPANDLDSLWQFCREIQQGDIVIANKGWQRLMGIGRVTGDYQYDGKESDFRNIRTVEWIVKSQVNFDSNVFRTPTVTPVHKRHLSTMKQGVIEQVENGNELWEQLFGGIAVQPTYLQETLADNFHHYLQSRQFWYSLDFVRRFVTSLRAKPFLILSGSSGTGKTKIAQYFAEYMRSPLPAGDHANGLPHENSDGSDQAKPFLMQWQPYNFGYQRMIVTVEMMEQVESNVADGVEIEVRFNGGQVEKSLIKQQGSTVRLGFRKHFMAWLNQQFQVGDAVELTIADGGKIFSFSKPTSPSVSANNNNLSFVSVRPDWLDHRGLLGYYNPLSEKYEPTPLLKLMLQAERDPDQPHFVILDEMNLAKVEYYFSDFLSCMESRRLDPSGQLVQEPLTIHQLTRPVEYVDDDNRVYTIPAKLPIPYNLYIIGTVNIDETTYMFSPKVLDRANVLECSEIDLQGYWRSLELAGDRPSEITRLADRSDQFTNDGQYHLPLYSKEYLQRDNRELLKEAFDVILRLHGLLEAEGHPFGYRVLDEVMTYLLLSARDDHDMQTEALDAQIVQKILPKLYGNRKQLERLLIRLLEQFVIGTLTGDPLSKDNQEMLEMEESYVYPLSGRKVYKMYKQLLQTGYCSFIC